MDPASIIGITAAAIGLASRITNELTPLFQARHEIKAIAIEVGNVKATLESLQQQYNPGSSSYTDLQLQQLHTVISDTNNTLTEIDKVIAKSTTTVLGRVTWSASTAEISSHRVTLIGCTSMLNVLIPSLSDQRGANTEAMVQRSLQILESQYGSTSPPPTALSTSLQRIVTYPIQNVATSLQTVAVASKEANVRIRIKPWLVKIIAVQISDFRSASGRYHNSLAGSLPGDVSIGFMKDDVEHRIKVVVKMKSGSQLQYFLTDSSFVANFTFDNGEHTTSAKCSFLNLIKTTGSSRADMVDIWVVLDQSIFGRKDLVKEVREEFNMVKLLPGSWFTPMPPMPGVNGGSCILM